MSQRGLDCKLYYDADGAGESQWTELGNVDDVTSNSGRDRADMSRRAGGGVREEIDTIENIEISFNLIWDKSDAGCLAIYEAYQNRATIGIAAMDGPIETTGQTGIQADCKVFQFDRTEPLRDGVKVAVVVAPTVSDFSHGWKKISGA